MEKVANTRVVVASIQGVSIYEFWTKNAEIHNIYIFKKKNNEIPTMEICSINFFIVWGTKMMVLLFVFKVEIDHLAPLKHADVSKYHFGKYNHW